MWCRVELCCGPAGERLRRAEWRHVGRGQLQIAPGTGRSAGTMVAALMAKDDPADKHARQLAWPLADVRVRTFEAGLLVIGVQIVPDADAAREVRQAWYCQPG